MNRFYVGSLFLGILFAACLPHLAIAQDFEGIIYYEIPDMEQQGMGQMPYMVKGSRVRMEFGSGMQKGAMLFIPEKSQLTMLYDGMKRYMTMNMDKYDDSYEDQEAPAVTRTGQTKTIAGRKCEVWSIESDKNTVHACMAKGMGNFMMPQNPMARQKTPAWAKEIMEGGAMPLEVIEIKNGTETVQMLAKRIEEKSLSADLFVIPDGYTDMSGMLRQH